MITVRCIKDPLEYYAACIHKCIKGLGTNDQRLMELVVAHCEVVDPPVKYLAAELQLFGHKRLGWERFADSKIP